MAQAEPRSRAPARARPAARRPALLPWKLVHAARLAEAGHLGRAAHYVAGVQARPPGPGGRARRVSAWQPEHQR